MGYVEGAKVTYKGMVMPATIISGPHPTHGADRWLIRKADDTVTLARETDLTPVDALRERAAAAAWGTTRLSGVHGWTDLTPSLRDKYLRIVDAVIDELKTEAEPAKRPLKVGDRIRILRAGLDGASVRKGEVITVTLVDESKLFRAEAPIWKQPRGYWLFSKSAEGTGWERVSDARG
jgi:hypothetical protein